MNFLECIELNPKISLEKGKTYPFVEMANVSMTNREPDAIEAKEFTSGVKFEDYDTVIARIEPCLQNGKKFLAKNIGKGFGSTEYLVFRPKDESVDAIFLYYFMQTDFIRKSMIGSMTGSTGRQRVNNDIFKTLDISIPEISTQKRIGEVLSAYDDMIENNQKQIRLLEEMAQRIYKEWFVDLHFPGHTDTLIINGVPKGWKRTNIGEYLQVRSGYAFKSSWWQETGYPVVKIKDIVGNSIDTQNLDHVAAERTIKIPDFQLRRGDVVIAMTGATIGKIGLVPEVDNLYTNQRVGKVFPNASIENPTPFIFCFYSQKSILEQILAISSSSSAQPNISGAQLMSFEIVASNEMINEFCKVTFPMFEQINDRRSQIKKLSQARDRLLPKLMSGEIEV